MTCALSDSFIAFNSSLVRPLAKLWYFYWTYIIQTATSELVEQAKKMRGLVFTSTGAYARRPIIHKMNSNIKDKFVSSDKPVGGIHLEKSYRGES